MRKVVLICVLFSLLFAACDKSNSIGNNGGGTTGQGGSLARFTIVGNYLYTVDNQSVSVFDISNGSNPSFVNKISVGFGIEAIFPFKNKLFLASNAAMYVYNIDNPSQPSYAYSIGHFTGCDPIVANDTHAFLTIHGGTTCGGTLNVLYAYAISDLMYPQLIGQLSMTNPFGLGLNDNVLYVCDNGEGLKIVDVSNPQQMKQVGLVGGENFVDVIITSSGGSTNDLLIAMLLDGTAYYDISNPLQPQKLATIKN